MNASAAAVTRESKTSFYYSFSLLPKQKREAIHAVYAFCRVTDDIVDEEGDLPRKAVRLRWWRRELSRSLRGKSSYAILNQLSAAAHRFNIPVKHFYELVRGMEMDLVTTRYRSFGDLERYCTLVASSVGLMCREIFGYRNESTREYSIHLGIALQLTNILRDLRDDAQRGRIYLPQEDLARFGYTEDDLLHSRYTPEFRALMAFECARARTYFERAKNALANEDKRFFFAARVMSSIYMKTLNRIEREDYQVFERRISISRLLKLLIALRYWLSHHLKYSWFARSRKIERELGLTGHRP